MFSLKFLFLKYLTISFICKICVLYLLILLFRMSIIEPKFIISEMFS